MQVLLYLGKSTLLRNITKVEVPLQPIKRTCNPVDFQVNFQKMALRCLISFRNQSLFLMSGKPLLEEHLLRFNCTMGDRALMSAVSCSESCVPQKMAEPELPSGWVCWAVKEHQTFGQLRNTCMAGLVLMEPLTEDVSGFRWRK